MTVMNAEGPKEPESTGAAEEATPAKAAQPDEPRETTEPEKPADENIFSDGNITKDTDVGDVKISVKDKVDFIESVVNNTRFTKDYSLFGGRMSLTVRSMTADETTAISTWLAKEGTKDSAGLVSGRYRKYLLSAQIARINGVDNPPLDQPLFETVGKDGKTVAPGWIDRCDAWDGYGSGVFQAILNCARNFDELYSALCGKAEDANFWSPDTP